MRWFQRTSFVFKASVWDDFFEEQAFDLNAFMGDFDAEPTPRIVDAYQRLRELIVMRLRDSNFKDSELSAVIRWLKEREVERLADEEDDCPAPWSYVGGVDSDWLIAMDALALVCSLQLKLPSPLNDGLPKAYEPWIAMLLDGMILHDGLSLDPDALAAQLSAFEALLPLYACEVEQASTWRAKFQAWFEALMLWLAEYFKTAPSDVMQSVDFAPLTERLLMLSFRYHEETRLPDEVMTQLMSWCAQHQAVLSQPMEEFKPPEEYTYLFGDMHVHAVLSSRLRYTYCINNTLKDIDASLARIDAFGTYAFHRAILAALNGDTSFSLYLSAYQETQAQLDAWSANVFDYRQACEKKLQGTYHYLSALDYLDNELHQRQQNMERIQQSWLTLLNRSYSAWGRDLNESAYHALEKASACFTALNESMRTLQGAVNWAEQGCYFTTHHEAIFAVEMNARNIRSGRNVFVPRDNWSENGYDLELAHTITDEAIDLLDECLPAIKRQALKLHPDKQHGIESIAGYVFEQYSSWRERAEHLTKMYHVCQFYKPVDDAPVIDLEVAVRHPRRPTHRLNLSSWLLHQTYLKHFNSDESLIKRPYLACEYRTHTSLFVYNHEDEQFWRSIIESAKDSKVNSFAILRQRERNIQELKDKGVPINTKPYVFGPLTFEVFDEDNNAEYDAYLDNLKEEATAAKEEATAAKEEATAAKEEATAAKERLLKKMTKQIIAAQLLTLESRNPSITQAQFVLDVVQAVLDDEEDEVFKPDITRYAEEVVSESTAYHAFFSPASAEGSTAVAYVEGGITL